MRKIEMDVDSELRLSYYQKVADIDARHDVALVKNTDDGRFYVRKKLVNYDISVLKALKEGAFPGIPKIAEIIQCGRIDENDAAAGEIRDARVDSDARKSDDEQDATGELILIEEYISGRTLADISDSRQLSYAEIASVIMKLCAILEPLHGNDPPIIHRDIKPSNVMMTDEGAVYLIDFDAGKMYSEGKSRDTVLMGTKGYAAPEQYGFGQSDARTDIYLLGSLMEELLDSRQNVSSGQDSESELFEIIGRCKSLDPKDRYQSVSELAAAVSYLVSADGGQRHSEDGQYAPGSDNDGTKNDNTGYGSERAAGYDRRNNNYKESWLPPGFRLHDPKRIVGALIWYAFIVYYAVMPITKEDMAERFGRSDYVLAAVAMFACTLLVGNYRGMADHFPLIRSGVLWKKIAGYVLFCFLITAVAAAVAVIINRR